MPILEVFDLRAAFSSSSLEGGAVDGMTFHVEERELVVLLGRSGSGKSVTILSILGLLNDPPGITKGRIHYRGESILPDPGTYYRRGVFRQRAWRRFRRAHARSVHDVLGTGIAFVPQDPYGALDPQETIGRQLARTALALRPDWDRDRARARALQNLSEAGLSDPELVFLSYPDELSGGMCQRAALALALLPEPRLLLADEPTSALDASIRMDVLDRLALATRERGLATLLITHDIGIALSYATRIVVVADGRVADEGSVHRFRRAAGARGYDAWAPWGGSLERSDRGRDPEGDPLSPATLRLLDAAVALRGSP